MIAEPPIRSGPLERTVRPRSLLGAKPARHDAGGIAYATLPALMQARRRWPARERARKSVIPHGLRCARERTDVHNARAGQDEIDA